MRSTLLPYVASAALDLSTVAALAHAQSTAREQTPTTAYDSAVTKQVMTMLLAQMVSDVAESTLHCTVTPWTMHFPADSGAIKWTQVAMMVRRAIHA